MQKLVMKDILPLSEYEAVREDFKKKIIRLKKDRRVALGEIVTLIFENRDSVRMQIQEMVRVEHLYDPAKIQAEIDIYNALIPEPNELSATFLIEIVEEARIKPQLDKLIGLDNGKCLYFKIGERKVFAEFEEGHSDGAKISAVHYIRFKFPEEVIAEWKAGKAPIALVADHPNYKAETPISEATRLSLSHDFD